ncbi:MAG: amino acid ABC transporter permease [Tissierellia bacterium]|nr:amino acid ABC transporter permease [Tissierellia bacterium]
MLVPLLKEGLATTLSVFFITLIFSLPLGLPVALARLSDNKVLSGITGAYIYLMRGTPLLLQLMFIFFGLPMIPYVGLTLGRYTSIYLAFVLNYAAYFAEILRGGIEAVDPGQWEGAKVLGLSRSFAFRKIILPQVIRPVFPSISNEVITLIKDTSLVYILGVMDVLKAAKSVSNSLSTISPYIYVGIIYLLMVFVMEKILRRMEGKINYD